MALFVFWRESAVARRGEDIRPLLEDDAHIVPEARFAGEVVGPNGRWDYTAFATRTHFYAAVDQVWAREGDGACVVHGLIWRMQGDRAVLLDAEAVAALLDRPGAQLPDDVGGEYAVVRLHGDGTLEAFSDRSGLHQIFRGAGDEAVLSNRASLVAAILDDRRADPSGLRWLGAMGYRAGTATAYRAVRQIAQEHSVTIDARGVHERPMPASIVDLCGERGWRPALEDDLDSGIAQAKAAILLGIGADGPVDLPITGGKDSRVILALCLAAGLRDRLRLFTRGYEGHPDVVTGAGIAAALGLPHRREAPHGSDEPAHWTTTRFFDKLMAQAWQTNGMVGGWDLILGERIATETLITGHMGEVLKAYSKKPLPEGRLDPVAMVRLQAPFDPMGLLRADARAEMVAMLAAEMDDARAKGATEADLPDLFYYRNRIPNWLGAIRAIKSFERQPVVPLGSPALLRLAFRLTPAERKRELLHYRIVGRCAPELLSLPFAMQQWDAGLGAGVPQIAPILPGAGAPPTFGNWQFSINHNPAIRAALVAEIGACDGLSLWETVDRGGLIDRLRHRRLDYFDGISMLGIVVAMFQEGGLVRRQKIGGADPAPAAGTPAPFEPPAVEGHLDSVRREDGRILLGGWAHARDWPAAQVAMEARVGGRPVAVAVAGDDRPDLIAHGKGDGRHGFSIAVPVEQLPEGECEITVVPFEGGSTIGVGWVTR